MQERCRRCHKLYVDNDGLATSILEQKLNILNYDVPEQGIIRVFDNLERQEQMNRELILGGVNIRESFLTGQDLEGYFMELLGGSSND